MSDKSLNVVLVGPFPPPYGGMAVQANLLERLLSEEGVKVFRINYNQPLPKQLAKFKNVRGLRTFIRWLWFVKQVRRFAKKGHVFHVLACSYGSFFLWTVPCILIGSRRKVPVVVNYRGGHAETFLQKYWRIVIPILKKADWLVVPSQFLFFTFVKFGLYSEIIPNILDIRQPARIDEKRLNGRIERPVIVVNRNFEPIYNVRCAILAFAIIRARFPEAQLLLIGDGTLRQELKDLVKDLGIPNVQFLGTHRNEEVLKIVREADLMLNPTNVDNMPISLLEAMALGVPIVTTDVGGIPYIVEHRVTALMVPANDHLEMAKAAIELLENSRLRKKLIEKAMKQAEQYKWPHVWPLWQEIYSKALNQKTVLSDKVAVNS